MNRRWTVLVLFALLTTVVVGCGSSGSGSGGSTTGSTGGGGGGGGEGKTLKVTWLYTGPENDGGYNTSQEIAMEAMNAVPGVETSAIYNVPYSQEAASITKQAIANGAEVVVETLGLGEIFTQVCAEAPTVKCYASGTAEPLPENTVMFWPQEWNLAYMAGVAAGKTTKTNKIGLIGSFDVPLIRTGANAFLLGCRSVDPSCTEKVVWINTYFDPSKATQAAETLISSGVDVLRNWVDDPSFCKVAERRGVWAVANFLDFEKTCPKSNITSTVWEFSNYFVEQAELIKEGKFTSEAYFEVPTGKEGENGLGEFGSFVPQSVKTELEKIQSEMASGKVFVKGPMNDSEGKQRLGPGETFEPIEYLSEWDWYVEGITASE